MNHYVFSNFTAVMCARRLCSRGGTAQVRFDTPEGQRVASIGRLPHFGILTTYRDDARIYPPCYDLVHATYAGWGRYY